jgi:hypothetical protein
MKYIIFSLALMWHITSAAMSFSIPKHEFSDHLSWVSQTGYLVRIYAKGTIEKNTASELLNLTKANNIDSAIVLFDSPGGSLIEGINLGQLIRELGFSTGIATFNNGKMEAEGVCASACAYSFVGGINRYFIGGNTALGLHQFSSGSTALSTEEVQKISGLLVAYMQEMGIDALAFTLSTKAEPEAIAWLSPEYALTLQISNNGIQQVTVELKQNDGAIYLRLEQARNGVIGRFLLGCDRGQLFLNGGHITNDKDAKNRANWATWSAIEIGNETLQNIRKENKPDSLTSQGSAVWVSRVLSDSELKMLLNSSSIGLMFGADGMVAYRATVNIKPAMSKITSFLKNCN